MRRARPAFVAALALVALLLVALAGTPLRVAGSSMRPGLRDGQWLRLDRAPALLERAGVPALRRGDLVVFRAPPGAAGRGRFVKRLVALPGDTVAVIDGVLVVDGLPWSEPYARPDTSPYPDAFPELLVADGAVVAIEGHPPTALPERLAGLAARLGPLPAEVIARSRDEALRWVAPLRLGPDEVFVLGDDRNLGASEDSRAFGPVSLGRLAGVVTPLALPDGAR